MGSGESGLYIKTHGSKQTLEALKASGAIRIIPGVDGVITGGNPTTLGRNLLQDMNVIALKKWSGYQAHHIIPKQLSTHPVIKKMGIHLDDASNGIFLQIPSKNISTHSRHRGYHSIYTKFVKQELDKININSSNYSLQVQVHALQLKLRKLQQNGLPMYESGGASIELWTRHLNKLK